MSRKLLLQLVPVVVSLCVSLPVLAAPIAAARPTKSQIHDAAANGNLALVQKLLKASPKLLNARNAYGQTPLHKAAWAGSKDVAAYLLSKGAQVNVRANDKRTPLHEAAWRGSLPVAQLLLAKGAEVNAEDQAHGTALHEAAYSGSVELVRFLLAKGARVNAASEFGAMPLHMAAGQGHWQIVDMLMTKGADPSAIAQTIYGPRTPAGWAEDRHPELGKLLAKAAAQRAQSAGLPDANAYGRGPVPGPVVLHTALGSMMSLGGTFTFGEGRYGPVWILKSSEKQPLTLSVDSDFAFEREGKLLSGCAVTGTGKIMLEPGEERWIMIPLAGPAGEFPSAAKESVTVPYTQVPQMTLDVLKKHLASDDWLTRACAAWVIGENGYRDAAPLLLDAIKKETRRYSACYEAAAISRLGCVGALSQVEIWLAAASVGDQQKRVKQEVRNALDSGKVPF